MVKPRLYRHTNKVKKARQALKDLSRNGYIIVVDMVNSTAFKNEHAEDAWLDRLQTFYEVTKEAFASASCNIKLLGDGVLLTTISADVTADSVVSCAVGCKVALSKGVGHHAEQLRSSISIRVVLSYGSFFALEDNDPVGLAVDKAFRVERMIPADCIGMTEEFRDRMSDQSKVIDLGSFQLRGITERPDAKLFVYDDGKVPTAELARTRAQCKASELWNLARDKSDPVFLVGGAIQSNDATHPPVVQSGDKDALLETVLLLSDVANLRSLTCVSSLEFRREHYGHHIISIGGPCNNEVTRRLIDDSGLPLRFDNLDADDDETPLIECATETKHSKRIDEGGKLVEDVGFFAKFTNPYDPSKQVILVCGIESPSVYGVVTCFSPTRNHLFTNLYQFIEDACARKSRNAITDFYSIIRFRVNAHDVAAPPSFAEIAKCIHVF